MLQPHPTPPTPAPSKEEAQGRSPWNTEALFAGGSETSLLTYLLLTMKVRSPPSSLKTWEGKKGVGTGGQKEGLARPMCISKPVSQPC